MLRARGFLRTKPIRVRGGPFPCGKIELSENEWVKACSQRDRDWLYVVFDCGTPHPRLLRVRDPFGTLIIKTKGGMVIDDRLRFAAAEESPL
jgi:hypothetical protein